jgi:two-component system chemotaxis response regulator CheY
MEVCQLKVRAMVVDDSRVMRNMVMQELRRSGLADFEFTEAENGADALKKFHPSKIDIVFIDWNMPKMSGIEFVRKVRSTWKNEQTPLVMITSEKTVGKAEEALDDAGANAFISKPFTAEMLDRKIAPLIKDIEARGNSRGGFFSRLVK